MEWNEEGVEGTVVLDVDNLFFFLLFQLLAMERSPCDFDFFFAWSSLAFYILSRLLLNLLCVCVCVFVLVVICSRLIRLAPVRATQTVAAGSRQQQHQRERLTVRLGLHDRQTQTKGRTDGQTDRRRKRCSSNQK